MFSYSAVHRHFEGQGLNKNKAHIESILAPKRTLKHMFWFPSGVLTRQRVRLVWFVNQVSTYGCVLAPKRQLQQVFGNFKGTLANFGSHVGREAYFLAPKKTL